MDINGNLKTPCNIYGICGCKQSGKWKKRAWIKYKMMGFYPLSGFTNHIGIITESEKEIFNQLDSLRKSLLTSFDDRSRELGFNVAEHRCWCGKVENIEVEYLFETIQDIEPEQNNGDNTIELIDNDYNTVWGNNGDNKFILNPDEKIVEKILRACWKNDGFCPCSPGASDIRDVNRFCPCQDFREKKACHCNLYLPKPEENE